MTATLHALAWSEPLSIVTAIVSVAIGLTAFTLAILPDTRRRDRPLLASVVAMCAAALLLAAAHAETLSLAAEVGR